MPRLGMTMREGRVVAWPVPVGGFVARGATAVVIESEKAEVEVEALASGWLRHVYVAPGETVPCGALLGALTEREDEPFDAERFAREHALPAEERAGSAPATAAPAAARRGSAGARERPPASPAARRRARQLGVDAAAVAGTGPGGRVTAADVEAFAASLRDRVEVAPGVRLEVPREGRGDPVLLLPGFGTDASVFARQAAALAGDYEAFGVNPRGVGGSDAPEAERYDVEQLADDAAEVAPGPAHVVGTSLGAAVALALALRRPERVRSLALLAPLVRPDARLLAVVDAWCRLAGEASPDALAAALLPWLFSTGFLADAGRCERTRRGLAATLARVSPAALRRGAAGLRAWQPPDARALRAPTLVVLGGEDLLTPGGEAWGGALPGARCHTLAGVGHALGIEAPDAVNSLLREHLARASLS